MMETAAADIGTLFKTQREKLGYSLQGVAQHTRIRKTYLESIESNQFEDLPGQAYVTGFIKVYARHLNLDSNSLLMLLAETRISDEQPSHQPPAVSKDQPRHSRKPDSEKSQRAFGYGFVAVLVLGAATYFLLPMLQAKDPVEVTSNQPAIKNEPVPVEEAAAVAGETSKSEREEMTSVQEVSPAPLAAVAELSKREVLPTVPPGGSILRVLALTESSLIIYLDDRKPHQYKLHDGLDLTWEVKEMVTVELAESSVARFWLGSRELDLRELESFQLQPATEE